MRHERLEIALAVLFAIPMGIAMFLFIFGGLFATLLGFGPPPD